MGEKKTRTISFSVPEEFYELVELQGLPRGMKPHQLTKTLLYDLIFTHGNKAVKSRVAVQKAAGIDVFGSRGV